VAEEAEENILTPVHLVLEVQELAVMADMVPELREMVLQILVLVAEVLEV
jgi:hypothetical protein